MNDTHLTSFIAVADSGSISKAAKRLYITPQALSQQIDLLEREYNAKLFTRSTKGAALTKAGEVFYKFANQVLLENEAVRKLLAELNDERERIVRIGQVAGPPSNMALSALYGFFKQNPAYRHEVVDLHVMDRLTAVENNIVDVVEFADTPAIAEKGLLFAKLADAQLMLMTSINHELMKKKSVAFSDLANRRITVFDWNYYRTAIEAHPELEFVQYEHNAPGFTDEFYLEILHGCEAGEVFLVVKGGEFYSSSANLFNIGLTLLQPQDTLSLGLVYRPDAALAAREFVDYTVGALRK